MIGHLQRNKVKYIIDKVSLIHSVDTIALAREINKRAEKIRKRANVLLQINVSGEESKFGMEPVTVRDFLQQAEGLKNIHIRGLMTIAPFTNNPEEVRPVFARLKELFEAIKAGKYEGVDMDYLSMGMTGDYEVAIEEGANIVRLEREYLAQEGSSRRIKWKTACGIRYCALGLVDPNRKALRN